MSEYLVYLGDYAVVAAIIKIVHNTSYVQYLITQARKKFYGP